MYTCRDSHVANGNIDTDESYSEENIFGMKMEYKVSIPQYNATCIDIDVMSNMQYFDVVQVQNAHTLLCIMLARCGYEESKILTETNDRGHQ